MKRFLVPVFALALCAVLSSCNVDSINPLSSPDTAPVDPQLAGEWRAKNKDVLRISTTKAPWMHIEIVHDHAANSPLSNRPESYDAFPTVIGKEHFLNVVTVENDDHGHAQKSYIFIRYDLSGNNVLRWWIMSQDAAAAAVRAGKIKGTVHRDKHPLMVGKPPHPDVDVTFEDSSANLAAFMQGADIPALFSGNSNDFRRVKTGSN